MPVFLFRDLCLFQKSLICNEDLGECSSSPVVFAEKMLCDDLFCRHQWFLDGESFFLFGLLYRY